jgi:hypothetical protein
VGPQDLIKCDNKSAHGTGVAAYENISPGALHTLTKVRQDLMTAVSGAGGEHEPEMEEQLLGKKRICDIPPAEETPASSCYVKDKEGRKNESTVHAEPQPANPAVGATEQAQSTFAAAATVDASALAVKGTQDGMPSKAGTESRASMGMDEAMTVAQRTTEEAKERGHERFRQ